MLDFLFGWKGKIKHIRKEWDHLREKTLGKDDPLRGQVLRKLDQIEQNVRVIEEQRLNRATRARLYKEVEIDLEEIKAILKMKQEELSSYSRQENRQRGYK